MSQEFDLKFDEYKQNDPSAPMDESQDKYPASNYARDLCFVLLEGKMIALNYSYLISKECSADGDVIKLSYSTCDVTVRGSNLKPLFFEMLSQIPRIVRCSHDRYNAVQDESSVVVNEITYVEKK